MTAPRFAPEVRSIPVVRVTFTRGLGTGSDPVRRAVAYYLPAERDGEPMRLLVEFDGIDGSPEGVR